MKNTILYTYLLVYAQKKHRLALIETITSTCIELKEKNTSLEEFEFELYDKTLRNKIKIQNDILYYENEDGKLSLHDANTKKRKFYRISDTERFWKVVDGRMQNGLLECLEETKDSNQDLQNNQKLIFYPVSLIGQQHKINNQDLLIKKYE